MSLLPQGLREVSRVGGRGVRCGRDRLFHRRRSLRGGARKREMSSVRGAASWWASAIWRIEVGGVSVREGSACQKT